MYGFPQSKRIGATSRRGRVAQGRRRDNGDTAAGEIGRHRRTARVPSGVPDPARDRDPAGDIIAVALIGVAFDLRRAISRRAVEKPEAA